MSTRFGAIFLLRYSSLAVSTALCGMMISGCNTGSSSEVGGTTTGNPVVAEDSSASGAVAGAIGGALSGSSSDSVLSQSEPAGRALKSRTREAGTSGSIETLAATCPTFATAAGATCSATGSSMWLSYSGCSFPNATATYTGTVGFFMSTGSAACGSFPYPGANSTLYRQYVNGDGSTTPSSLVRRSTDGRLLAIDNHTANLSNFDSATLAPLIHGGYGASVSFGANGERTTMSFGHRINTAGVFDQVVYGSLTVGEAGPAAASRSVSGTVTVYHNGLQIVGTSTISNLVHSNTCCLPVSGTITTTFSQGTNVAPTALGSHYIGKSETLTITGCGTGSLQNYDGTTETVTLNRCY